MHGDTLGDKTMLATVTLAADALAILAGQRLGSRLPERMIKIGASAIFVVIGFGLIIEGLR
jgi:putative Ca2+/H+ antiporter (TMEM165/GDT1 family)